MSQSNKPPTSEATASNVAPRFKLSKLLGRLYTAQRESEQSRKKLAEKIAAKKMLHDFPKFQPMWCRREPWPTWSKALEEIREDRISIDELGSEYREPPVGELLSLRDHLVRVAGRAESRIYERLGAPLWKYVVAKLIAECAVEFDDLYELEDFEGHLRTYCESVANGTLSESGPTEFSRWIAGLDREDFADDLLTEIWARFPRQCERLKLLAPARQEEPASATESKKLPKWLDAKAIADEFDWDPGRVRSELSKAYYGPGGAATGRPALGKAQWRATVPNAGGSQPQYIWNTILVIPYLESIFENTK